jgi:hypothetical protein
MTDTEHPSKIKQLHSVLVEMEFQRNHLTDEGSENASLSMGGSISMMPSVGNLHAAQCRFFAGEIDARKKPTDAVGEDNAIFSLDATYMVAIRASEDVPENERRMHLLELASGSAWLLFRTLFAQVTAQGTMEVPSLPPTLELDWSEDTQFSDDEDDAENPD